MAALFSLLTFATAFLPKIDPVPEARGDWWFAAYNWGPVILAATTLVLLGLALTAGFVDRRPSR